MLKKFSLMMILAVALIFAGGQQNQAEAGQVYMGSYSDGSAVYLLTDTVYIRSRSPYSFTCTVRAGRDYLDYSFYSYRGSPYYKNNEGYSGYVHGGQSPVAASIYRYVVNNW